MLKRVLHLLFISTLFCPPSIAADESDSEILGVIVQRSQLMTPEHWQALSRLRATPEVPVRAAGSDSGQSFEFAAFESDLRTFAEHGFHIHAGLVPHVRTIPWSAQTDEDGKVYTDRQNPFDPAFQAEWRRLTREFCRVFSDEVQIDRVYLNPPSFFGENEYYMGPNWLDLKMLCYGEHARSRFVEWLKQRYGTPAAVAAAWEREFDSWEAVPMPKPHRQGTHFHTSNDWLDLTEWRTEYLTDFMGEHLHLLAENYDGEVAFKFSVGDYSALWGTDTASLVSRCRTIPKLVLHMTNGHSLPDLEYAHSMKRRYNAARLVIENDGHRYRRTEIAKIVLNYILSGADEFNFSQFGSLVGSIPAYGMTETGRALADAVDILRKFDVERTHSPVAFFHSNTTCRVRAPLYRNRDVSHVYDFALSNGAHADVAAFDWGRYLNFPDVTGEQLVLDGDLEGRRILIIPNTSWTVFPTAVYDKIMDWVEAGGILIAFGEQGFAYRLADSPPAPGESRCIREEGWEFPQIGISDRPFMPHGTDDWFFRPPVRRPPSPIWEDELPPGWESDFVDETGGSALARRDIGSGRIFLFPAPIPKDRQSPTDTFYAESIPLLLRHIAESEGVVLPFALYRHDNGGNRISTTVALGYVGWDKNSERHLFVGGAYDESGARVRFVPHAGMSGPARIILIDMHGIQATPENASAKIEVRFSRPSQYHLYRDPTNREPQSLSLIPITEIDFELPENLVLSFRGN